MWKLLIVSILWGCTNPFMREASKTNCNQSNNQNTMTKLINFVKNWKFLIPFLLNQCGSILYMKSLADYPISLTVPVSTALTAFFTAITAYFLGERHFNTQYLTALILIIIGTIFCQLN
eukprot:452531_1